MNRIGAAVSIATLGLCSLGFADTVSFVTPANTDLGTTTTSFKLAGQVLTIKGFNGGDLFVKNGGTDEQGLGLTSDPNGAHEIFTALSGQPIPFIQVDVSNLITAGITSVAFNFNSVESESLKAQLCPNSGSLVGCVSSLTGSSNTGGTFSGLTLSNRFIDVSATHGDILLYSMGATGVPEPRFYGVLVVGFTVLIGLLARRRMLLA